MPLRAHVLLADASPQSRRMGTAYLEDLGWQVQAVADGPAALAALPQSPALVLTDAALPGMGDAAWGGVELCRRVRAAAPATPVLILLGALAQVPESQLAAADGVLRKPLSSAGLETWLAKVIANPAECDADAMLLAAVQAAARDPS